MSVPTAAQVTSASWESRAACLDCDPDLFFPVALAGPALRQIAQAKAICARCPVRRECLRFALTTHQVHGVWGGTSEEEPQPRRHDRPRWCRAPRPGQERWRLTSAGVLKWRW